MVFDIQKETVVSLTTAEIEAYPDLFKPYFEKMLDKGNIAGAAAAYAKNKDIEGATPVEALKSGITRLEGGG